MAAQTLLYINNENDDHGVWVNESGNIQQGSLNELASQVDSSKLVVICDSTNAHITAVDIPTQNRQRLQQAVPYALEDQFAEDVDELHFVLGKREKNEMLPVAAINKQYLESIIANLEENGLKADALIANALTMPIDDDAWNILLDNEKAIIRTDKYNAISCDSENLVFILEAMFKDESIDTPERIIIHSNEKQSLTAESLKNEFADHSVETILSTFDQHPICLFAMNVNQALPLNFLQGAYKPVNKMSVSWQRWRPAMILFVAWLVLDLGANSFNAYQLEQENNRINAEIDKTYRTTFPGSKRIVNARVQMEQKLKALRAGGGQNENGFLHLLAQSQPVLSQNSQVVIQSINFRNGKVDMNMTANKLQMLEAMSSSFANLPTIKAELLSASAEKDGARGRLRIENKSARSGS